VLTRDTPDSMSALDRLRAVEAAFADRLLTLAHRQPKGFATVGHYFASAPGKALAQRLAARLDTRGVAANPTVFATPAYLVQQTGAVAAAVDLPAEPALDAEPTRAAARLREEAYALYLGLLEDLGGDPAAFLRLDVKVTDAGKPAAGVPVTLDHRWLLLTDTDGVARFDGLPARAIVTVEAGEAPPGGPAPVAARVTLPRPGGVTLALPKP
jgi:hypothetical protein